MGFHAARDLGAAGYGVAAAMRWTTKSDGETRDGSTMKKREPFESSEAVTAADPMGTSLQGDNTGPAPTGTPSEPVAPPPALWPWIVPLLAYMAVPMVLERFGIESTSQRTYVGDVELATDWGWLAVVAMQALVGTGCLLAGLATYRRWVPFRVSIWTLPLGVIGLGVWLGLCDLGFETWVLQRVMGFEPESLARPGINPAVSFPGGWPYWLFLFVRFWGLVVVVPIAEELLLRGYFVRWTQQEDWWNLRYTHLSGVAVLVSGVYGALTHPNEMLAAVAWFTLVTCWIRYSGRFWDGVLIHAVTNALLGWYVMHFEQWHLW